MYEIVGSSRHITISKHYLMLIIILAIWELAWKAVGLWKAGRNHQLIWFIAMLVLNTVGILEIVYIFFFQNNGSDKYKVEE